MSVLFSISTWYLMSTLMLSPEDFTIINKIEKYYVLKNWETGSLNTYDQQPAKSGWKKLNEINEQAYMAIVISEDWSFFDHEGVDTEQLRIAFYDFLLGKKLRGASTISQQLVKNLFTQSERSFSRKIKEFILTKYLERKVSKEKILETYLNNIQYGENLYGIAKASQFYFDKNTDALNVKEGAFLAMLLPSPVRYSVSYRKKELTDYAYDKISKLLFKLKVAKVISPDELAWYQELPFEFSL